MAKTDTAAEVPAAETRFKVIWSGALGHYQGEVCPASAFGEQVDAFVAMGAIEATTEEITGDVVAVAIPDAGESGTQN